MTRAIEATQPLMNMITYRIRDRARIADLHATLTDAIEANDANAALRVLEDLSVSTLELAAARRSANQTPR